MIKKIGKYKKTYRNTSNIDWVRTTARSLGLTAAISKLLSGISAALQIDGTPDGHNKYQADNKQYDTHGRAQSPCAGCPELVLKNVSVKRSVDTAEKTGGYEGCEGRNEHQYDADGRPDPIQRPCYFQKSSPGLGTVHIGDFQELKIKIEQGTQPGKILRLRGKGLPEVNGYGKGDLLVNVNVWIPKKLTGEEQKLMEKMINSQSFTPQPGKDDKGFFERMKSYFE